MDRRHLVLCGGLTTRAAPKDWQDAKAVSLATGPHGNVHLRISDISRRMAAGLPEIAIDLVELATYVYCADQAVRRGGTKSFDYGTRWRRNFRFEVPVRRQEVWSDAAVIDELTRTLTFLSDDDYEFAFHPMTDPPPVDQYFEWDESIQEVTAVQEVLLFSGGLDSLGGAVQKVLVEGRKVALVSHRPVGKIDNLQRQLVSDLRSAVKDSRAAPFHVPVLANKDEALGRESSQRSRSFLYASLAAVVAQMFGLSKIHFYENGVVSFNLPISEQIVGARATRTTHPQTVKGFAALFSRLFQTEFILDNPFLWKTKADILNEIKVAGYSKLCARTRSCAHTWGWTTMHSHCGRCSQCVDRRLVALAAGYGDDEDPPEMYKVDVLRGARNTTEDITLVEEYVRTMTEVERIQDATQFGDMFPQVSRLYNHLSGGADAVAQQVFDLYKRHAGQVCTALDRAAQGAVTELRRGELPATCLLRLAFPRSKDIDEKAEKRGARRAGAGRGAVAPKNVRWRVSPPTTWDDVACGLRQGKGGNLRLDFRHEGDKGSKASYFPCGPARGGGREAAVFGLFLDRARSDKEQRITFERFAEAACRRSNPKRESVLRTMRRLNKSLVNECGLPNGAFTLAHVDGREHVVFHCRIKVSDPLPVGKTGLDEGDLGQGMHVPPPSKRRG